MSLFPQRKVLLISVSFAANGTSSYRDANNITTIAKEKWDAKTLILTDNTKNIKSKDCLKINNKKHFLLTLENQVKDFSKTHDVLFTISAHGYSRRGGNEADHRDEYIRIGGQSVLDHEIRNSFYRYMDDSCLSLCLVDTCHSGTMLDLPWCSTDGKNFKKVEQKLVIKPQSFCISACNDNELAGEDISDFGGFGGKLTCIFLDYFNKNYTKFDIVKFYLFVSKTFVSQRYQRSHPILSSSNKHP